ncbi:hypothetical protein [Phyllobacterium myrsinacearum]|uniref:Uncharacterized protein n=1 Tax=Phyllobacterium myrsinacearum TaxID=28101 RepID=A0A839EW03_9HYPH|nr:hypothetical protein [Phyllobacterium myrsinacearum]MBA8881694.1 hypothetical protein [Phyllobacterium myrsinacearum]
MSERLSIKGDVSHSATERQNLEFVGAGGPGIMVSLGTADNLHTAIAKTRLGILQDQANGVKDRDYTLHVEPAASSCTTGE